MVSGILFARSMSTQIWVHACKPCFSIDLSTYHPGIFLMSARDWSSQKIRGRLERPPISRPLKGHPFLGQISMTIGLDTFVLGPWKLSCPAKLNLDLPSFQSGMHNSHDYKNGFRSCPALEPTSF
jgi:hypothetical protein